MINFHIKFKEYYRLNGKKRNPLQVYEEWLDQKQDYLDRLTPKEYFQNITDIDLLVQMLTQYEEDIPPVLIKRIKDFGFDAINALSSLALKRELYFNEFFIHGPINAIYILGEMKNAELINVFIRVIDNCGEVSAIFDYTADAIMKLGNSCVEPIIECIKKTDNEFLRSHLSWILSRLERNEDVFNLLCQLCEDSPHWKGFYAEILCDYGDKRAVPMLQRLVCENKFSYGEMDQIERALVLLGGEWNWEHEEKSAVPYYKSKSQELQNKKDIDRNKILNEELTKNLEVIQQRKLSEINQNSMLQKEESEREEKHCFSDKKVKSRDARKKGKNKI